jgi:hypothetical protein
MCNLATELEMLGRIAAQLLGRTLLPVLSEP